VTTHISYGSQVKPETVASFVESLPQVKRKGRGEHPAWYVHDRLVARLIDPTTLLVPGDLLQRVCTFEVDVAGAVNAKLSVSAPTVLDGLGNVVTSVTPTATFKDVSDPANVVPVSSGDTLTDGESIEATITVNVPSNAPQDLTGHLNDITVTATQS